MKSETLSETRQGYEKVAYQIWDEIVNNAYSVAALSDDENMSVEAAELGRRAVDRMLEILSKHHEETLAAGRLQGLEEAQCDKQFHMYVWTKEPFFYAVAQARSVHEARTLMLEEVGSGDGSCPEREEAAKWIKEQQPFIFHRENATFALTDSAEQVEMSAYIEKLQQKLAKRAECKCWCGKECGCPCHDGTIREKANG
jgi:hypothetical protein